MDNEVEHVVQAARVKLYNTGGMGVAFIGLESWCLGVGRKDSGAFFPHENAVFSAFESCSNKANARKMYLRCSSLPRAELKDLRFLVRGAHASCVEEDDSYTTKASELSGTWIMDVVNLVPVGMIVCVRCMVCCQVLPCCHSVGNFR